MPKVTHMRNLGSKRADMYGVPEEKLNRLGRWTTDGDSTKVSQIMLKHYLNNCPLDACIGIAGFHVGKETYNCSRGTICGFEVSSLKDDTDMNLLLEYLTPGLIRLTELAEQAYHRPKEVQDRRIPSSAQNYGFTRFCFAVTVSWIQDACLLLESYPVLATTYPYKWLMTPDKEGITEAFKRVSERVKIAVSLFI